MNDDKAGVKNDKILNNSYNQGETTYDNFTQTMKVHDKVRSLYDDQLGEDISENTILRMLDAEMHQIFITSPFYEKYKKPKKPDSSDRLKMYYYFKERLLKDKKYTNKQIFIAFAEFFQVNYDQLYLEIGVLDKEGLLREINENKKYSSRIKTKRLF